MARLRGRRAVETGSAYRDRRWKVSISVRCDSLRTGFFPIWKTVRRVGLYGTTRTPAVFP
jgi:hypothetical protein